MHPSGKTAMLSCTRLTLTRLSLSAGLTNILSFARPNIDDEVNGMVAVALNTQKEETIVHIRTEQMYEFFNLTNYGVYEWCPAYVPFLS